MVLQSAAGRWSGAPVFILSPLVEHPVARWCNNSRVWRNGKGIAPEDQSHNP